VIHALETYEWKIHSTKTPKYIGDTSSSSNSSVNDELGVSSDESPRTAETSEMTDDVSEHSQVTKQPSASAVAEGAAAVANVSSS